MSFPATFSLVWSRASARRLEHIFLEPIAIQDQILIPFAEELASFPAPIIEKTALAEKFRSNEVAASVTSAQSFFPKVAFIFVESALCLVLSLTRFYAPENSKPTLVRRRPLAIAPSSHLRAQVAASHSIVPCSGAVRFAQRE